MELGNMIFGNSRGRFEVNRNMQDEWYSYMEEGGFDSYGYHDQSNDQGVFENAVFRVQPYYWGDCECGFEQKEIAWSDANKHAPECYQTRKQGIGLDDCRPAVEAALTERNKHQWESPAYRSAQKEVERASDREMAHKDKVLKALCVEMGIPWNGGRGCMVHCTCDYGTRWAAFLAANSHAETCRIVTPNFMFKPTGFRLDWYKYPLRDSYSSEKLTPKLMRSMWAECLASLAERPEGQRPKDIA